MTFATLWPSLYAKQTASTGFVYTATVGEVEDKACIPTELTFDEQNVDGGVGEGGSYEFQMLESEFPTNPAKESAITIKRDGTAVFSGMKLKEFRRNNGICYLTAYDPATNP